MRDQLNIIRLLCQLGFYIAWGKSKSPTTVCTYLDFEIDTVKMEVHLPSERIAKLRAELLFWSNKRKATLKQLQVLTGHLVHCASVIRGGNAYMHHVLTALNGAKQKRRIKLNNEFHSDIGWW